jgi:hypothetical protein
LGGGGDRARRRNGRQQPASGRFCQARIVEGDKLDDPSAFAKRLASTLAAGFAAA